VDLINHQTESVALTTVLIGSYRNKLAFRSKAEHPHECVFSYARLTFLVFWPWPWTEDLDIRTKLVKRYSTNSTDRHTHRQTDMTDRITSHIIIIVAIIKLLVEKNCTLQNDQVVYIYQEQSYKNSLKVR